MDISFLRDCVPKSLHLVLDAVGDHPVPVPQFELEHGDQIVVVDLAWPNKKFRGSAQDAPGNNTDGWILVTFHEVDPAS